MKYKGYWQFTPCLDTMTTHIVDAPDIFTAYKLLAEWGSAHKGVVDHHFDFEVQCLDGYCISCTMTSAYDFNGYNAINHRLIEHLGKNICFKPTTDNRFSIHYCNDRYEDMFSDGMADYIRDALLASDVAYLFKSIDIKKVGNDKKVGDDNDD